MGNCDTCVGEHPMADFNVQPVKDSSKINLRSTTRPNPDLVASHYPNPQSILTNKNLYPHKKQSPYSQFIPNLFKSVSNEQSYAFNNNHSINYHGDQQRFPAEQQMGHSRSGIVASSIINSSIYRIASTQDNNIRSQQVKSRIKNMPILQSSQRKNIYEPDVQIYLQEIKGKYVGNISQTGQPQGYGKIYFDNKDFLEGTFINGRCQGNGRFIKADGSYFEGDLRNNVADGSGRYVGRDGFKYEGQWKNNMANGSGQATYADGSRYIGSFLNNIRHGKGTLYYDKLVFRGNFRNGKLNGQGEFSSENGETYTGQWKDGKKHGDGKYNWPDDSSYEGEYLQDSRHGKGKMTYSNGQYYDGQWKYGQKDGKGQFISTKQNFVGYWKNGHLIKVQQ